MKSFPPVSPTSLGYVLYLSIFVPIFFQIFLKTVVEPVGNMSHLLTLFYPCSEFRQNVRHEIEYLNDYTLNNTIPDTVSAGPGT